MNSIPSPSGATTGYYKGQFLVATPNLRGSCFSRSLIYVCTHSAEGAMGIIINQALSTRDAVKVLEQLSLESSPAHAKLPIHFGGPVEMMHGYVLHSIDYFNKGTYRIDDQIALSSNVDVIKDIVEQKGPKEFLIALGYSGWAAGQLEREIEQNHWFTAPATKEILFSRNNASKWELAAFSVGVDLQKFSCEVGHA